MKKGTKSEKRKRKPGIEDYAVQMLRNSKKPLSTEQITQRILSQHPLKSKYPRNSVYSVLYRSKRIKRVGPSLFILNEEK